MNWALKKVVTRVHEVALSWLWAPGMVCNVSWNNMSAYSGKWITFCKMLSPSTFRPQCSFNQLGRNSRLLLT